ncbi:hypothetical protein [Bdellovibrio svalbardensis]|uniref:Uncharacterized protein n=1 Tax=Bdellovibrio svalbardensis TaxID=2972972 RepID=A0ABT6DMU0_9BACT|nr:hypothetical protein [Bdellovibrio svalbardensis]MDG0818183.1 hypothetical protein [Bdellovibrio svalbardensis]
MKSLFVFVMLAAISYSNLGRAQSVGVRTGVQKVYGQSENLLNQTAFTLQVEYTPAAFSDFKSWLISKDFSFLQNWNFITEFGYTKYTGSELSRRTEYLSPSLQLRSGTEFAGAQRVNYQFGVGAGVLLVERDGQKTTQVTSNALASIDYQNLNLVPELSVGFETGMIFDSEYPISYNGMFVRYFRNF